MEFGGVFDFASTVSPQLSLCVGTVNRFNRSMVFIHASRAVCRFILACCVHSLCVYLKVETIQIATLFGNRQLAS